MSTDKISAMTALAAADVAATDEIEIVDKSDTTDASTGTNKKALIKGLIEYLAYTKGETYTQAEVDALFGNFSFDGDNMRHSVGGIWVEFDGDTYAVGSINYHTLLTNVQFEALNSDPITQLVAGRVYYNTITNKLKCYNGSTWNDLF